MTLDASRYRLQMTYIIGLTKDKTPEEIYDLVSIVTIASGVPIIVVLYYLIELYGFDKKLYDKIGRLKEFYGVTEVINL
jgi:hypothetical protein